MRNVTNMSEGRAIAGTILVDKINEIADYPNSGELTKILKISKSVGGCVPNVAIDLKRLDPKLCVQGIGLIGEDEEAAGLVSVKNMASGEQLKLSPADAAAHIAAGIAVKNSASVIKE